MPGLGDLLHLVSGQTLLGTVRERHAQNLGSARHGAAQIRSKMGGLPQLGVHQQETERTACNHTSMHGSGLAEGIGDWSGSHDCNSASTHQDCSSTRGACHTLCSSDRQPLGTAGMSDRHTQHSSSRDSRYEARQRQPADVLDLFLDDKHVATAVRECWTEPADHSASMGSRTQLPGRQGVRDGPGQPARPPAAAAGVYGDPLGTAEAAKPEGPLGRVAIYRAEDEGGPPFCTIDQRSGRITTSAHPRAGVHHQMISSATPFVRSLHFVVHTGTLRQLRQASQGVPMGCPVTRAARVACLLQRCTMYVGSGPASPCFPWKKPWSAGSGRAPSRHGHQC